MATEIPSGDTATRVEALQRHVRLLWIGILLVLVTDAALVAVLVSRGSAPATGEGSVHATQIELRDPEGYVHALIGKSPDGGPGFFVRDRDSRQRVGLRLGADDEPELSLADRKGTTRARLYVDDATTTPRFVLRDASGAPRILLGFDDAGAAAIQILDAAGRVTWEAR